MILNVHIITYWTKSTRFCYITDVTQCVNFTLQNIIYLLKDILPLKDKYPIYMRNMLTLITTSNNLRGNYILTFPGPETTTYKCPSLFFLSYS